MRKVTLHILRAGGNELANQLWNYASIYAYSLELGFRLKNPVFFEYGEYFSMPAPNWLFRILFFLPFRNYTQRKTARRRRLWRKAYSWYSALVAAVVKDYLITYVNEQNIPFYLAPSQKAGQVGGGFTKLALLEKTAKNIYFDGWLFRNPIGLEKYRPQILTYFAPNKTVQASVNAFLAPLKKTYAHVIGVHLRQGDYRTWRGGELLISEERLAAALREYVNHADLSTSSTCFIIASDGPISPAKYTDLNIIITGKNMVEDLFILAGTEAVIGSDSSFGDFAAFYGDIPHIIVTKTPIDWPYYANRNTFFQNKYCNWVHY